MHWTLKLPALLAGVLLTAATSAEGSGLASTHHPRDSTSEYLISPSDHYDTLDFEQKLFSVVPQSSVYTAEYCVFGVLYWTARLTSDQAKSLEDPSVEITNLDSNNNDKRDQKPFDPFDDHFESPQQSTQNNSTGAVQSSLVRRDSIVTQNDASDDMKVVSTKKGRSRDNAYRYKSHAGQGVTIFVIDSGFQGSASASEFPKASSYEFLYAKFATRGKDDPAGHGTRVASRIVGTKYGLAKNVNLVFAKVDLGSRAWPSVIDALGKVSDYIMDEGITKGVINMSFKLPDAPNRRIVEDLETILDSLADEEMILNTSSGNEGIPINSYPALLKQSVPAMNVVGAVDNDGKIWAKSNTAKYVNIYAPGVDLRLVGREGRDTTNEGRGYSGTSYACAGASAIAAYLYREKNSAAEVNSALADLSWSRIDGGPNVIYNGVDG